MEKLIGIVTISYDQDGKILNTSFQSEIELDKSGLLNELIKINCTNEAEKIQLQADIVVASWFNEVSSIEIADKFEYKVQSTLLECDKFDSGRVKTCKMLYKLVKL